jgi:predicted nucleic acid-binding protein
VNFVVDSSFALAWVMRDEAAPATDQALDSLGAGARAFVPALWHWEVANALLNVERRKRASKMEISGHLLRFQSLPIDVDEAATNQAWGATHLLAQRHRLTSYDAAYLELALRRGLPLATLDRDLAAAAAREKVPLLPRN